MDLLDSLHRCEPTCRCGYFHEIVFDVRACNLCDVVKTERWRQLIFASRKYELSPLFSFDNVTHVTRTNFIQNLVEISTSVSRFAPVIMITCFDFLTSKGSSPTSKLVAIYFAVFQMDPYPFYISYISFHQYIP